MQERAQFADKTAKLSAMVCSAHDQHSNSELTMSACGLDVANKPMSLGSTTRPARHAGTGLLLYPQIIPLENIHRLLEDWLRHRAHVTKARSRRMLRLWFVDSAIFDWTLMTTVSPPSPTADIQKHGVLFVFAAGVLWSTVGLGIRLIEEAAVWQILLYRSISMSLFLYIVIRIRSGESPFSQVRHIGFPAVIAGLSLVTAYSGGIYAIQNTSVANAMLLFATSPFMAAVLGWLVLREPVRRATWIAIAVAIGGIAIMVADKSGSVVLKGSLAALGSALGFAIFTVALRWGKAGEMLPSVFLSGIFAIIITFGVCQYLKLPLVLTVHDGSIAMGMGVFQVGAGLILYTLGSRSLPAAELALLSLAEVLLGPLWVWLFLGETATVNTLLGGAVLLLAIAGNAVSGKRRKPPPITTP
jgi:drug/metabolite transporter (DMT)-like permease